MVRGEAFIKFMLSGYNYAKHQERYFSEVKGLDGNEEFKKICQVSSAFRSWIDATMEAFLTEDEQRAIRLIDIDGIDRESAGVLMGCTGARAFNLAMIGRRKLAERIAPRPKIPFNGGGDNFGLHR